MPGLNALCLMLKQLTHPNRQETLYSRPLLRPPTEAKSVAGWGLNVLFQVVGTQFEPHTRRLFTWKTSLLFHLSNDPTTNTDQTNAEADKKRQ